MKTFKDLFTEDIKKLKVIIMRGISGSGKSTYAKQLSKEYDAVICSADDYFNKTGNYIFDRNKLKEAHGECLLKADGNLQEGRSVIIDNTNVKKWEYQKYIELANKYNA